MLTDASQPDPFRLVGQTFDANYEIVRVVGSGGIGIVYEAEHKKLRERRALKVLKLSNMRDPKTAIERLWREARSCSALKDAGAVEVYEARIEQPGGRPYFAMELLRGVSLHTQWMTAPQRRMPPIEALNCIRQVAASMAVAHEAGIVHRDLKPENIFLCRDGAVRVLDFGCAHIAEEPRLTAPGALIGIPQYMPPEQLDFTRSKPDPRMDIYALGVTLYHVLTGQYVYRQHRDPIVVAKDVHLGPPRDIAEVAPELPSELNALVRKAIARNPEERFATMAALESEINRLLRSGTMPLRIGPNAATLARTQARTKKTILERLMPRRAKPNQAMMKDHQPGRLSDASGPTPVAIERPDERAASKPKPAVVSSPAIQPLRVAPRPSPARALSQRRATASKRPHTRVALWVIAGLGFAAALAIGVARLTAESTRPRPARVQDVVAPPATAAVPTTHAEQVTVDRLEPSVGASAALRRSTPKPLKSARSSQNDRAPKTREPKLDTKPMLDENLNGLAPLKDDK